MRHDDFVPDVSVLEAVAGFQRPRVAVVLGSGLAGLGDHVEHATSVPYSDVAAIPQPACPIVGHPEQLILGSLRGTPVVLFQGRVHQYQGVSAREAAFPARIAAALGCETLVVTNAAGSVHPYVKPSSIMLIKDHINLMGTNPLTGWPGPEGGSPFVSMRDAYNPGLRTIAHAVASEQDIVLTEGVYAALAGPNFETPAEVRYLNTIGADVVGMSTVPEVIAARALGLRVLGFSFVTNVAAGVELSHEQVLAEGQTVAETLTALMLGILHRL
jgi:inosine/guanosine/xanthosine phosphorylase family protein